MSDKGKLCRLYLDESGDHVYRETDLPGHRYLGLVGCFFMGADYLRFHKQLESFKINHFDQHPDEPVILHRSELINRRGPFARLLDERKEEIFNQDLIELIKSSNFRIIGIVIDKKEHFGKHPSAWHPYHLCLGLTLERYCGYLNHFGLRGDVWVESRGKKEDQLLANAYEHIYIHGTNYRKAEFFQRALTSKKLKLRKKEANISGLQLADLLAHPVVQDVLLESSRIPDRRETFGKRLCDAIRGKYNCHIYTGEVDGYGKKLL